MEKHFAAQIAQEHSENVKNLALSLNVPPENIVFRTEGCSIGTIGVYIKFNDESLLHEFVQELKNLFHCIIEEW